MLSCLMMFGVWGCKKLTYDDAIPVVQMTSVTLISADSVAITGAVVSNNGDGIQYEGFCHGSDPNPSINEQQIIFETSSNSFTAHVFVQQDSTYYFRCFAANSFSYGLSAPMKFTVPHAKPAIAPCALTNMILTDNGTTNTVDNVYSGTGYASYGVWGLEADCNAGNGPAIRMSFNKLPTNGAYVTVDNAGTFTGNNSPTEVYVEYVNFNTYSMQSGDSVYVAQNANKTLTFSFCNLHYTVSGSKFTDSGKFTTN